jgi:hypothetical protein
LSRRGLLGEGVIDRLNLAAARLNGYGLVPRSRPVRLSFRLRGAGRGSRRRGLRGHGLLPGGWPALQKLGLGCASRRGLRGHSRVPGGGPGPLTFRCRSADRRSGRRGLHRPIRGGVALDGSRRGRGGRLRRGRRWRLAYLSPSRRALTAGIEGRPVGRLRRRRPCLSAQWRNLWLRPRCAGGGLRARGLLGTLDGRGLADGAGARRRWRRLRCAGRLALNRRFRSTWRDQARLCLCGGDGLRRPSSLRCRNGFCRRPGGRGLAPGRLLTHGAKIHSRQRFCRRPGQRFSAARG